MLCRLEAAEIKSSLEYEKHPVDNPEDILSALEHFMGTEGKAREMVCPECRSPHLTCLSRVQEERRTLGWFCSACRRCCEYEREDSAYQDVPWAEECASEQRRVPDDPKFWLTGAIDWEDSTQLLRQLPNRKAAGDSLVPAELWKKSPERCQKMLFNQINAVLAEGECLPAYWQGGQVQFLFKKYPAEEIPNWRPVCLLNVSYRLLSSIIARRLDMLAEAYGLLDQLQEAFRRTRNTRRQFECLTSLI
jgi:hypothetical protein